MSTKVVMLTTDENKLTKQQVKMMSGVQQVVSGQLGTLAAGKAVSAVVGTEQGNDTLGKMIDGMQGSGVLAKNTAYQAKYELLARETESSDLTKMPAVEDVVQSANLIRLEKQDFASKV
jgi:hypothetical protein